MSTPINTNTAAPGVNPPVVAPVVTPVVTPVVNTTAPTTTSTTTTSQGPPPQQEDGSWTDAQVDWSNQLMMEALEQSALEDMMFQQAMMDLQTRAAMTNQMLMNKPRVAPDPPKLTTGPELKSSIFDDSDGGDGGDE